MRNSHLHPKHERFVVEYLVDSNGARAAATAGYGAAGAAVAAHRLLRREDVRAALSARQGADSQRLQIDRQATIQGLLEGVELAKAQGNPAAMISGWREVGRMLGFYEPERRQVEVTVGADDGRQRYETMTDAELAAVAVGTAIEV